MLLKRLLIKHRYNEHVLRNTSTGEHVNSVTLSVKNESDKFFDFNRLPLEFELDVN